MYIYSPNADAYLCVNKINSHVYFEPMDTLTNSPDFCWEHWDLETDRDGNRRLVYYLNNSKRSIAWFKPSNGPKTSDFHCAYLHDHANRVFGDRICTIDCDQLFLKSPGQEYVVFPSASLPLHPLVVSKHESIAEAPDAFRVEMFAELPHSLK